MIGMNMKVRPRRGGTEGVGERRGRPDLGDEKAWGRRRRGGAEDKSLG